MTQETLILGGGCFWCIEAGFSPLRGVLSAISGYAGGGTADPDYESVCRGRTGHVEVIQITYDPARISYVQLLDIFWHNIDPLSAAGQFCDRGSQYRSAVFYLDAAQQKAAVDSKLALEAAKRLPGTIVTEITHASEFYPAEEYHQDFYKKNPSRYHSYRNGCGRDQRLRELWGAPAAH